MKSRNVVFAFGLLLLLFGSMLQTTYQAAQAPHASASVYVYVNDRLVRVRLNDPLTGNFFGMMRLATKANPGYLQFVATNGSTYQVTAIGNFVDVGGYGAANGATNTTLASDGALIYAINTSFTQTIIDSSLTSLIGTYGTLLDSKLSYQTASVGSYGLQLIMTYYKLFTSGMTIYGTVLAFRGAVTLSSGFGATMDFPVADDTFTAVSLNAGDVLKITYVIQVN